MGLLAAGLLLSLWLAMLVGSLAAVSFGAERSSSGTLGVLSATGGNTSSSGDPSGSSSSDLCPSTGPTILGIQWNCVAVLNLTEVVLILGGIGIVVYVFRDSDLAELPGEASEVPITPREQDEYREDRKRGIPYHPPELPPEGDE
jgi:hypothetical protein